MNIMATSSASNKKGINRASAPKSEPKNEASEEDGRTYGVDWLNFRKSEYDLESDSEWILDQGSKFDMKNKK